jgi:hypothetical protein
VTRILFAAAAAALLLASASARAEVETTYLFGFTEGSDTLEKGHIEAESKTTGRFGKADGSYATLLEELSAKFAPFENFSIAGGLGVSWYGISGVTGLNDLQQFTFDSVFVEMRYRILDRKTAPIGLTIGADPYYGHTDEVAGTIVDRWGANFWLIADKELIENKLFGAFNLGYLPRSARATRAYGATSPSSRRRCRCRTSSRRTSSRASRRATCSPTTRAWASTGWPVRPSMSARRCTQNCRSGHGCRLP